MLKLKSVILVFILCSVLVLLFLFSSYRLLAPYLDLFTVLLSISFYIVGVVVAEYFNIHKWLITIYWYQYLTLWVKFGNLSPFWPLFLPHLISLSWVSDGVLFFFLSDQIVFIKLKMIRLVACMYPYIYSFNCSFFLLDSPRFLLLSLIFCFRSLL